MGLGLPTESEKCVRKVICDISCTRIIPQTGRDDKKELWKVISGTRIIPPAGRVGKKELLKVICEISPDLSNLASGINKGTFERIAAIIPNEHDQHLWLTLKWSPLH